MKPMMAIHFQDDDFDFDVLPVPTPLIQKVC